MVNLKTLSIETAKQEELVRITDEVSAAVKASGIKSGIAAVISAHCTTGVMANESLPCLEKDILRILAELVPEREDYRHAHYLHSYGACGGNTTGHVKGLLTGNSVLVPIKDGDLLLGAAQDIYFCEYDGPQIRTFYIQIIGE